MEFGLGVVVVAVEVEEAVDEVEGAFAERGVTGFCGGTDGGVGADEDFAVAEGDDVGGGGVVHELGMDGGDGGIVDEGDFDFLQLGEVWPVGSGVGEDVGEGGIRCLEEPLQVEGQGGLVVVEFQSRHDEGKACFREKSLQA